MAETPESWERLARRYFGDEQFPNAWALYCHAARLVIDGAFTVSVSVVPDSNGIVSPDLEDLFGDADEAAMEVAKAYMAEKLAAAVMVADVQADSDRYLGDLLEEQEVQRDEAAWRARYDALSQTDDTGGAPGS